VIVRLAESGGRAVERKITLPVQAAGNMIGVTAVVLRPLARRRRETRASTSRLLAPDGKMLAATGLRYGF